MINSKILVILLLLTACGNDRSETDLFIVNLAEAFGNPQEVRLSEFATSIEYIHLEETEKSILFMPIIEVTDDYIIARSSGPSAESPIPIFDRHTGKFVRTIGKIGRGPGEFRIGNVTLYNHINEHIYGIGYNKNVVVYDLKDTYIESFKLPIFTDDRVPEWFGTPSIKFDQYLDQNTFVAHINNTTGIDNRFVVLFNKDSIIKIFPNYQIWERSNWRSSNSFGNANFYHWNNTLNMKSEFNDTLFQITSDSLIPRFVFILDGYSPPPNLQEQGLDQENISKYFFLSNIFETSGYLFFQLRFDGKFYSCYFDKATKKTIVSNTISDNGFAFIDDISGFIPFRPEKISSNYEMIYRIDAGKVIEWKRKNPDKLTDKAFDWVNKITLESNLVIAIAKLK